MESSFLQNPPLRGFRSVPETRRHCRREETGGDYSGYGDICCLRCYARTDLLLHGKTGADLGGELVLSDTWSFSGGGDGGEVSGGWEVPGAAGCIWAANDRVRDGDEFLAFFSAAFEV